MRRFRLLLLAAALFALAAPSAARDVRCRVSYVAADGLFVDAGAAEGLSPGDSGRVLRGGAEIARIEVAAVSRGSSRTTVISRSATSEPAPGDDVVIDARAPLPAAGGEAAPDRPAEPGGEPGFVPLLERQTPVARAKPKDNVLHGFASLDFLLQDGDQAYLSSSLRSGGTLERAAGTPWTVEWFGNLRGYGGDAFDGDVLEGVSLYLYELSGRRRFADDSFAKIGRFSAEAIRALGTIDGAQYETPLSEAWRAGIVGGLQPDRDDLSPTVDEPTAVPYLTLEKGDRKKSHYTGTFAILASAFDGEFDRLALAIDQRYKSGRSFTAGLSAEIDFDVGASLYREGVRLTQLDLWLDAAVSEKTWLHFGVDRFEQLDNASARRYLGEDADLFPEGDWSVRAGASTELGKAFLLSLQVSYLAPGVGDGSLHGSGSLTWREAFGVEGGSVVLSVYDLSGEDSGGVGGSLSGYFPAAGGRWSFLPSVGIRVADFDAADSDTTIDVRIEALYRPAGKWSGRLAIGQSFGDFASATRFEAGIELRW